MYCWERILRWPRKTACILCLDQIALVITTDVFPLAYEVMDGNTSDRATLRGFLHKTEKI
jgi:hypothetical protein